MSITALHAARSARLAAGAATGAAPSAHGGGHGASASESAAEGREVLVTPPVCLTGETFGESAPFFVDWLTITQEHPEGGLPLVDAGAVWATDETGEVKWRTVRRVQHEGSFETSISVKCDGSRIELSGNVGRFGRPDNVWGFDLWACLDKANGVLLAYGLPPFTAGTKWHRAGRDGKVSVCWTGARISRIDLTANYETGSPANAHALLQYLGTQHKAKQRGRTVGEGTTVEWGRGSRRQYWKCYDKAAEMKYHGCTDTRLIEHVKAVGLVRLEGTIRSNALTELGCAYLGDYEAGWSMPQLIRLFNESAEILSRAERKTDDLDELPRPLRATARDYLAGMEMRQVLSRPTFYRQRKALLPYGIDIAMTNVAPFKPRVQVIELKPAARPNWYQLAA